jgi:outer membrane protein assembly factor BamE (lipoprotein component of BamABCDE complex)
MRITGCAALLAALLCAGCATTQYRPVVDSGVTKGNYEDDVVDLRVRLSHVFAQT